MSFAEISDKGNLTPLSSVSEQLNKFEALLQHLPADWQDLAVKNAPLSVHGKLSRRSRLLRLVFTFLMTDYSLRFCAATPVSRRIWMNDLFGE